MVDRPINFKALQMRALLDGRKTQDRRVLKPQPEFRGGYGDWNDAEEWGWKDEDGGHLSLLDVRPNRYAIGDRLWVREAWQALSYGDYLPTKYRVCDLRYAATDALGDAARDVRGYHWRPSTQMPRWASRMTLIVTDVRVQRLQDISEADAMAEGIGRWAGNYDNEKQAFKYLWESIYGPEAWAANPWVVATSFDVVRKNIDEVAA